MKSPVRDGERSSMEKERQREVFLKLIDIQGIHVCIKAELRPVPFCTFSVSLLTFKALLKVPV